MVRGHNRGLRPSARRADPLLRFGFRVDRIEDLLRVAGLAVTETVIASSRASLREKLAMRNVARRPWDPLLPAPVISPSITANSTVLLFRNASRTAPKSESAVSQTISNSSDASLRVPTVARQPLFPRVETSASPVSRFSVKSRTLPTRSQVGAAYVPALR